MSEEEILSDFPILSHEDIQSVFAFAAARERKLSISLKEGYTIVSKDNDFRQRTFLFGPPPKVIWLSVGNGGTKIIRELLLKKTTEIKKIRRKSYRRLTCVGKNISS